MTQLANATLDTTAAALLQRCAQVIESRCDGAVDEDGAGYNKLDAYHGRELAARPLSAWTPALTCAAYAMLRKYRKQLADAGIDWDTIPVPPPPPRTLTLEGGGVVVVRSPYLAALVAAVKDIPGRRFNGEDKVWAVPLTAQSREPLQRLAATFQLEVDPATAAALEAEPAPAEPGATAAAAPGDDRPARYLEYVADHFELRFPFDETLVAQVRTLPGARWDKAGRFWRIPASPAAGPALRDVLRGDFTVTWAASALHACAHLYDAALRNLAGSSAKDAEVQVDGLGGELRPFQRAGVAQLHAFDGLAILGDEMGLGKTIQALAATQHRGAYPALVICPASLKLNWLREARLWLPGRRIGVVHGTDASDYNVVDTCDVVIVNYDLLGGTADAADKRRKRAERRGRVVQLTERQQRLEDLRLERLAMLSRRQWQAVWLDEAHKVSNYRTQRTQAALVLCKDVPMVVPMTGTPQRNRPSEWLTLLQLCRKLEAMGGFWGFLRLCGMQKGQYGLEEIPEPASARAERLVQVNALLRQTCLIRRLKVDVLPELPAKQWSTVTLPITNRSTYQRAEADFLGWLSEAHPELTQAARRAEKLASRCSRRRGQRLAHANGRGCHRRTAR